jgi:L-alanine-DL-glutamate epimerase-like enolase superfamily enzyme
MKIAKIESIPLRIPFTTGGPSDTGVWGKAGLQTVDSLIVSVITDTGVVGWGETFGFTAIPAVNIVIDSILAPECIGRDARQLGKLSLDLQKKFHVFGRSGAFMYGLSAIDIALWDIAGRVAKQPVHQLLGGSGGGDAIVPKKGAIAVPQSPGLGPEPSADVIRKYRLL